MGTFAGNHGHRTANPAEGQPTRDAAYEWVAREFLRKFSLDRDEGFAAAVARRFMEAPAKVGCPAIGKWIDKGRKTVISILALIRRGGRDGVLRPSSLDHARTAPSARSRSGNRHGAEVLPLLPVRTRTSPSPSPGG